MDTNEFLATIFRFAETGYTQIFALPSKTARAVPVTDFSAVSGIIAAAGQQNIYFSPGVCTEEKHHRWSGDDITGITALWADIDIYHPGAHAKQNLPKNMQEAMSLIPDGLPPSIIVSSGYGLQFWWLLREYWFFDAPKEKAQAHELIKSLQGYIRHKAASFGWHLDSVPDLCRVMRLPGTYNMKIPAQTVMARVVEYSEGLFYNPFDIEKFLDEFAPATEQVAATTAKERKTAFERRPTDGPAEHMLKNCLFLQHCQINAKTISYDEWLAALTNIVRATDGIEAAHIASTLDPARYNQNDCDKKIDECLQNMNPQNCEHIQNQIGFRGCPSGGCGVTAPCAWSLGKVPQARALLKSKSILTPDDVYKPETLGALAIVEKENPVEYDSFYARLPREVNKNTFKKTFAEYKREHRREQFTVLEGGNTGGNPPVEGRHLMQTVPDIPVNLWLPPSGSDYSRWEFSDDGVFLYQETADGKEKKIRATYVPIIISERIKNVDNGLEKVRIAFKNEVGGWESTVMPKDVAYNSRTVTGLIKSGPNFTSENAKILVRWFSALEAANRKNIPVRRGVAKMGWRDQDTKFILPGIESNFTIDLGDSAAEAAIAGIGQGGDFNVWLEAMMKLRTRNKARFIMAASFAAPLLKIVGQRSFLIHNWDTTRGGKSATLMAALSVWGNPEEIVKNFDDTRTNTERTAALFTDLPLGINEYELLNERKKGDIDSTIYMISEGKGRGRANKEGLQKTVSWRTIALMTGESQITRSNTRGGVFTRLIEIKGGPLADDDIFASGLYPLTARHYGHAGKIFIEQLLQADHDWLRKIYNENRIVLRETYPKKIESHMDAIACIALAEYLASLWIFGIPDEQAKLEASIMANTIIKEIITKTEASEPERAWEWLADWLAANESKFMKDMDYPNKKAVNTWFGYIENEHVSIIKAELIRALKEEGFNYSKVLAAWADEGKFPCDISNGKRNLGTRSGKRNLGGVSKPYVIRIEF